MMPPVRRSLAVMVAALLAGVFAVVGTSVPAGGAPTVKGYLHVVSIADDKLPQDDLPAGDRPFDIVKGRAFNVVVEVRDAPNGAGQLLTVTRATDVALKALPGGPGVLGPTTKATIERGRSGVTISGVTYSQYGNNVELQVVVVKGVDLEPSEIVPVDVALTAISKDVNPAEALDLQDPNCAVPTTATPTCGRLLLPKGSTGAALMSVGSCEGLGACSDDDTEALVVTAVFGGVYTSTAPASVILACDKVICGQSGAGLPQIDVIYTFENGGDLGLTADDCPSKGVLGPGQAICVDYVQSSRNQGDLYTHVLLGHDVRLSHP